MARRTAGWPERATRGCVSVAALVACLAVVQCGGGTPPGPTPPPPSNTPPGDPQPPMPPIGPPSGPQIFVGAGDIAMCNVLDPAIATGRLAFSAGGTVFTLGDNAYDRGTAKEFKDCYEPAWGALKSYTRPALGNHEYEGGADPGPYFAYFGTNAGLNQFREGGYYSHELGTEWHAIVLNSNISMALNSQQGRFLQTDLADHRNRCTIAYWHHPLFTSGQNGPNPVSREFWRLLYRENVDIILNGHDHLYERFLPQDPDGRPDSQRGIREFIVGTGGAMLYEFVTRAPNSDVRIKAFGVLKLTLRTDAYDWQFIRIDGAIGDSGTGVCH